MTIVGSGNLRYELVPNWAKLPSGWELGNMGIVTDADDRVYAWNRSAHPMVVFDRDGEVVEAWSESVIDALVGGERPNARRAGSVFAGAHGGFIDTEQHLYFAVHVCHVVLKTDRSGKLLLTLGEWDSRGSNRQWEGDVEQYLGKPTPGSYPPFCVPTDVAVAQDGSVYVSDGYGNARVHRFAPDGTLLHSFGRPGKAGPGSFHLPHGIWVDRDGRVLVADRLNHRIQVFSADGSFLDEWTDVLGPTDIFVDDDGLVCVSEAHERRICSILDRDGNVLARLKDLDDDPSMPSSGLRSRAGHAVWVDSEGSIYLNHTVRGDELVKYVRV